MKTRTLTLSVLAILAAIALARPQEILLRRTFQPNAKDSYAVEMNSKNTLDMGGMGMGEQEMEIKGTMDVTLSTGKVEGTKAEVEIKTTNMKFEYGGMAAMAAGSMGDIPKEVVVKGKMDERNRVSETKIEGVDPRMQMMMNSNMSTMGQFIEFPEKPVKVGDSWEVVLPKNELAGLEETKLKATLMEERADGYALSMTGVIPMKLDLAELAKKNPKAVEGMPMTDVLVTGTMDLKMEGLVEKGTGRTIRLTTRLRQKTTTNVRQMGITSDSSGETVVKMTLKP